MTQKYAVVCLGLLRRLWDALYLTFFGAACVFFVAIAQLHVFVAFPAPLSFPGLKGKRSDGQGYLLIKHVSV